MDDLISRQAAIDSLKEERCPCESDYDEGYLSMLDKAIWIMQEWLPSAQPEIIRCKECKHRYIDGENVRFNVCELNHNKVQSDDWFCADAERRTNETG